MPLQKSPRKKLYTLKCPRCHNPLPDLWFLRNYLEQDNHGLYCCTGCIVFFKTKTNTHHDFWEKYHNELAYNKEGPKEVWDISTQRTEEFLQAVSDSEDEGEHANEDIFCDEDEDGVGLGEDEDVDEDEDDDDDDDDYVDDDWSGGGEHEDEADHEDEREGGDDEAAAATFADASLSASAVAAELTGPAVPIAGGVSEEQPPKRARSVVQHRHSPTRFPPGQPLRVRVYPSRFPRHYSSYPVPLAPPPRDDTNRVPTRMQPKRYLDWKNSPAQIGSILDDIKYDQRQLRLTCNRIATVVNTMWHEQRRRTATMEAVSRQLEELLQKLNQ